MGDQGVDMTLTPGEAAAALRVLQANLSGLVMEPEDIPTGIGALMVKLRKMSRGVPPEPPRDLVEDLFQVAESTNEKTLYNRRWKRQREEQRGSL